MTRTDIVELLGAYAVDAVTDIERRRIERALESDAELRREADELLAVSAALADDLGADEPAPDRVWTAIATEISPPAAAPAPRRRPVLRWAAAVAGAAAVAVVAVLAVQVFLQRSEISDLRGDPLAAAVEETEELPGAMTITMTGDTTLDVVLGPDGVGYVLGESLPALDADSTYQLWAIVDDRVISAGVLGAEPAISPFRVDGPVAGFALTVERAGGVVSSEQDPVALGLLEG
jgi:anti-sigma-K factor RskA